MSVAKFMLIIISIMFLGGLGFVTMQDKIISCDNQILQICGE